MFSALLPRLPALLATLLLASCASTNGFQYSRDIGPTKVTERASVSGEIIVAWRFGSPEWVSSMCSQPGKDQVVHGCARLDPPTNRCLLFAVAPKDFEDRERLALLGHEFWHCQGTHHD